jgi:hypothetical protein
MGSFVAIGDASTQNATSGISFIVVVVDRHPVNGRKQSKRGRRDLGDILISLRRYRAR